MFHFMEQIQKSLSCSPRHWKFSLEKKIIIMLTKRLLILHSHHSAWIVQQLLGISGSSGSWDGRAGGWHGICSLQTCRPGPAKGKTSQSSICCFGTSDSCSKWRTAACYLWSPPRLLGHPADFRLAHQTAEPITTILLLDDDVTTWTFHGLSIL